jgi:hypothetical protein
VHEQEGISQCAVKRRSANAHNWRVRNIVPPSPATFKVNLIDDKPDTDWHRHSQHGIELVSR